ncbi:MAG: hypothetical protein HUU24_06860 [Phycisphaerae bacterium]|nr:hypothetical protein [Phycisphaerae bacterium]
MAATATLATLASEMPAAWTTRALEAWLEKLPARERAELIWARPGLTAALDSLLNGPLNADAIDAGVRRYARVSLGCQTILLRALRGDLPLPALRQALLATLPQLKSFFAGEPTAAGQAEQALRAGVAMMHANESVIEQLKGSPEVASIEAQLPETSLDELVEDLMASPAADGARGLALLAALLEAVERSISIERGRELARLSLIHMVRGVTALRCQGLDVSIVSDEPPDVQRDRYIDAMARCSLEGSSPFAHELNGLLYPFPIPLPVASSPPPPLIQRLVGRVAGAMFLPTPSVCLEGQSWWISATPELVDRALSLREVPVQALVLCGPKERLLRVDPVSEQSMPDSATRTRDMVHDWDELLRRLAQ